MFRGAAMTNQNEGILIYTCPESSRAVVTGISTNDCSLKRLASVKFSVWCPYCETPHVIKHKQPMLVHLQVAIFPSRNSWAVLAKQEAEQA